jgi:hypothetical protein
VAHNAVGNDGLHGKGFFQSEENVAVDRASYLFRQLSSLALRYFGQGFLQSGPIRPIARRKTESFKPRPELLLVVFPNKQILCDAGHILNKGVSVDLLPDTPFDLLPMSPSEGEAGVGPVFTPGLTTTADYEDVQWVEWSPRKSDGSVQ